MCEPLKVRSWCQHPLLSEWLVPIVKLPTSSKPHPWHNPCLWLFLAKLEPNDSKVSIRILQRAKNGWLEELEAHPLSHLFESHATVQGAYIIRQEPEQHLLMCQYVTSERHLLLSLHAGTCSCIMYIIHLNAFKCGQRLMHVDYSAQAMW